MGSLGLEGQTTNILDITVPSLTIPARPGRNLAVIEVAAMNDRYKTGFNAAKDLQDRMLKSFWQSLKSPKGSILPFSPSARTIWKETFPRKSSLHTHTCVSDHAFYAARNGRRCQAGRSLPQSP